MKRLRRMPCSLAIAFFLASTAAAAEGDRTVTQNSPTPENPPPADGFVRLRAPVLGLAIERSAAGEVHRLVAVAAGAGDRPAAVEVIASGSLETCESRLLAELDKRFGRGNPNIATATLGGKQVWGDVEALCGWRIQENVFTGHNRLLDPGDIRRAWGSYEACRTALEAERIKRGLKPRSDHLVMVLHGLGRSRDSFAAMSRALEAAGYEVAAVDYPSTRRELREHSLQIRGILDREDGIKTVSFVTHSLGGIVVRDLLSLEGSWKERIKVGRLVMIAPPNRGSVVAETLRDWLPARAILGDVLPQLTPEEVAAIPPLRCEFGIIAGGTGTAKGLNPILDGDNDGVVTVESTRLEGAKDFLLLDASHTFIMTKPACIEATVRFLKDGRFASAGSPPH